MTCSLMVRCRLIVTINSASVVSSPSIKPVCLLFVSAFSGVEKT